MLIQKSLNQSRSDAWALDKTAVVESDYVEGLKSVKAIKKDGKSITFIFVVLSFVEDQSVVFLAWAGHYLM